VSTIPFARAALAAALPVVLPAAAIAQQPDPVLPDVTVTGTREAESLSRVPAAVGVIPAESIRRTAPAHPSQLLGQVPGVAAAVTNGEGHTTAIRQPFTTAPVYLFLEDGLPIRATGFFNHNALYETNLPQAGGVEVVRGPGTALYGSDAIGGIVNVLTRMPSPKPGADANLELGGFGWRRLLLGGDTGSGTLGALRVDLNATHTDGWRDATAYDRRSGTLRWDAGLGDATVAKTVLSFSRIDQQTGANSPLPLADYLNRPTTNYRPIAFRTVDALRLSTNIEHERGGSLFSVTPYVRDNGMDLLASFALPSDPTLARTSNRSFGVAAKWRHDWGGAWAARTVAGIDLETSPGGRREDRVLPTVSGTGASRLYSAYTLGARVFDYDVTFDAVSPYLHGEVSPVERLRVTAGLRWDRLSYRFDNRIDQAVVRDPTSGAFYGQVADTSVSFSQPSPKLGATWAFDANTTGWAGYSHGFRAPSEGQLFRPTVATSAAQATQLASLALGLKPIQADQLELGLRGGRDDALRWELVAYRLDKRDDLVTQRDPATNVATSVNAGRTRHQGVEAGLGWRFAPQWRADAALSYAVHRYVDWVTATADFSGKEMEGAPRWLSNARLTWQPSSRGFVQLEWVRLGSYWLEASNNPAFGKYDGHDLFNLRAQWPVSAGVAVFARVYNLTDVRWADSASVSSNTAVYSPGLPRTVYAGVDVRW